MAQQQKALWLKAAKGEFEVGPKPIDKPGPGELLVKIEATALNPVDWKVQKYAIAIKDYPAVLGSDSAGVVEEVGEGVTGWSKGDRIVHEGFFTSNTRATFQQYTTIPAKLAAKIPANISFEEAASVPLGIFTAAIGLYNGANFGLGLTEPWTPEGKNKYAGKAFVVYGASTSVGQFALQLAKLSGFSPLIAVASSSNFELLKSLGATLTIDRKLVGSLSAEVAKLTSEPVEYAYDAWASAESQQALYDLLAPHGHLALVLPKEIKEHGDKEIHVITMFGTVHIPDNHKIGVSLFGSLERLLQDGTIKPNPVEVLPGGLQGIIEGLSRMAADKVSGKKLIAKPQETA